MTKPIPGAHPNPSKPHLAAPPRSCDAHMHIFGPESRYPYDPERNYTPPDALLPTYLALIEKLGIERAVFIQPSVYGTDNACHFDAMQTMGLHRARGVAVIPPKIDSRELRRLHDSGFRGARFNVVHTGGSTPLDRLEALGRRVAEVGWHIQVFMRGTRLPEIADRLMALPGDFVIDHLGNMDYRQGIDQEGFVALQRLLDSGKCWVKLSGAYRFDLDGPPYSKAIPFARALVDTNPERLVWATDWPHPDIPSEKPGHNGPMPDDAILLDALLDWVPDERTRQRILVDNPEKLYGFSSRTNDRKFNPALFAPLMVATNSAESISGQATRSTGDRLMDSRLSAAGYSCGSTGRVPGSGQAKKVLRHGHDQPTVDPYHEAASYFQRRLTQETGGEYTTRIFPHAELGNEVCMLQSVVDGALEMSIAVTSNAAKFVPELGLFSVSYLFADADHLKRVVKDEEINRLVDATIGRRRPEILRIANFTPGVRNIYNNRWPIHSVHDLKDMRMRVMASPIELKVWRRLGTLPTWLPFQEIDAAIRNGIVQAAEDTAVAFISNQHYKLAPFYSLTGHQWSIAYVFINAAAYNSLPRSVQDAIVQIGTELADYAVDYAVRSNAMFLESLGKLGVKVNDVERGSFVECLASLKDEVARELEMEAALARLRDLE